MSSGSQLRADGAGPATYGAGVPNRALSARVLSVPLAGLLGGALVLGHSAGSATAEEEPDVPPLPSATDVDYQLGGPVDVPENVGIVARDRTEEPTAAEDGIYDICYVNGFQIQPDARTFWRKRWALVLKDADGEPVEDEVWKEWLLDIRTERKRERLAGIVGGWIAGCAEDGFEATELDNLDSFNRSDGLIRPADSAAYAALLVQAAHDAGLAVGQKNRATWDGTTVGFDFVVAEECGRYDECGDYVEHYGDQVVVIEYRRKDFEKTCEEHGAQLPVVLRDYALSPDGVREYC